MTLHSVLPGSRPRSHSHRSHGNLDAAAAARTVGARGVRATAHAADQQLEPDGDSTVATVLQAVQRLPAD